MTKVYSNDGEGYPYQSLGELIDYRDERPTPEDTYWVADKVEKRASEFWSLDQTLRQMAERADEELGEYTEGFAEMKIPDYILIEARIAEILDEMVPVDFYGIANPVEMHFEKEDCVSLCSACNGSGEGQYEGTRCTSCSGKGEC